VQVGVQAGRENNIACDGQERKVELNILRNGTFREARVALSNCSFRRLRRGQNWEDQNNGEEEKNQDNNRHYRSMAALELNQPSCSHTMPPRIELMVSKGTHVRVAIMKTSRAVVKVKATLSATVFQNGRDERAVTGNGGAVHGSITEL
jgi:hypothetical protein